MFDRVLNMPQVLNKPEFLICLGSQYARILNIQEFWICQDSAYASDSQHGSEYTRILNMPMFLTKYTISTQGPEYAWIFPGNVWIGLMCLSVHESAWMVFVLHAHFVISCLLECMFLISTKVYSLKEHKAVFSKR